MTIHITPRELEVLQLLARGHKPARIAFELGVAPGTVANKILDVRIALGALTNEDAVRFAVEAGLIDGPEGQPS